MPELNAGQPPPDHYYADNLIALIEGVRQQYGDILTPEEWDFGAGVIAMPADAQRLLARLISRKGPLVRVDSLNFREIDDTPAALTHLIARGFVSWCPQAPAADLTRLLTRAELARCFGDVQPDGGPSPVASMVNGSSSGIPARACERLVDTPPRRATARKREILEWIEGSVCEGEVHQRIERRCPWVVLDIGERLELYRLLFFGDRRRDLACSPIAQSWTPISRCLASATTSTNSARSYRPTPRRPCSRRFGSPMRTGSSSVAAAACSTG